MSQLALPTLLSYRRSLQPSIGEFYYKFNDDIYPIIVKEITVRGSIADAKSGTGKNEKNLDTANIQKIDIAQLPLETDTYYLSFSLTVLPNVLKPNACNDPNYQDKLMKFTKLYKDKGGFLLLAKRYLENIINGRWLWRNQYAKDIDFTIKCQSNEFKFNKSTYNELATEQKANFDKLAKTIASTLSNPESFINIQVTASGKIGKGQEVFPSQEFIEKRTVKREGDKSRELAKIDFGNYTNVAIMHSQKIGNAIRTIDTWYADDAVEYPIAIEPYGTDQTIQFARRKPKTGKDLYTYLQKLDELIQELEKAKNCDELSGRIHFVAACLIRGGVYSGESKKDKNSKSKE